MLQTEQYPGTERRTRDRSKGIELRRRRREAVEEERRRSREGTAEIAAALELLLDERKTRRAMLELLEQWLAEARNAEPSAQNPDYVSAVERSIEIMKRAPDVPTGIAMLQRQ